MVRNRPRRLATSRFTMDVYRRAPRVRGLARIPMMPSLEMRTPSVPDVSLVRMFGFLRGCCRANQNIQAEQRGRLTNSQSSRT